MRIAHAKCGAWSDMYICQYAEAKERMLIMQLSLDESSEENVVVIVVFVGCNMGFWGANHK